MFIEYHFNFEIRNDNGALFCDQDVIANIEYQSPNIWRATAFQFEYYTNQQPSREVVPTNFNHLLTGELCKSYHRAKIEKAILKDIEARRPFKRREVGSAHEGNLKARRVS